MRGARVRRRHVSAAILVCGAVLALPWAQPNADGATPPITAGPITATKTGAVTTYRVQATGGAALHYFWATTLTCGVFSPNGASATPDIRS